jgi:hypothetical protein
MSNDITDASALANYRQVRRSGFIMGLVFIGVMCAFMDPMYVLCIYLGLYAFFKFISILVPDDRDPNKISKDQRIQNASRYR